MSIVRLIPLYFVVFIGYLGFSLTITVFTPMVLSRGGSSLLLGILLALYPFGQFFGSPALGSLSDRFGRRPVLIISLICSTIFYAVIAFALTIDFLPLLMIALFVAGLSEGNIVTAQSSIADIIPVEKRARFFGYVYLCTSSGYVVGPLMAGQLAKFSYATPFWIVSGLLLITLLQFIFSYKETHPPESRVHIHYLKALTNIASLITYRRIRIFYLANFFYYLAIFGFFRSFVMYLVDSFHMDVEKISFYIAAVAAPMILVNLGVTGFITKRYSPKSVAVISGLLMAIFLCTIILPRTEGWVLVTILSTTIFAALCLPSVPATLSGVAFPKEQGRVMGNNQSLQGASEALTVSWAGVLALVSFKLPLIFCAVASIIGALILWKAKPKESTPK